MKRWWIKGKYRVAKKYGSPYHDGVGYSWKHWEAVLNEVRALKPGDVIYNCYTKQDDIVKNVVFKWMTPGHYSLKKDRFYPARVRFVDYFYIETQSNYWIYDCPSLLNNLKETGEWDYRVILDLAKDFKPRRCRRK